jgi:hypothetical protein
MIGAASLPCVWHLNAHLLESVLPERGAVLWTRDKRRERRSRGLHRPTATPS